MRRDGTARSRHPFAEAVASSQVSSARPDSVCREDGSFPSLASSRPRSLGAAAAIEADACRRRVTAVPPSADQTYPGKRR